MPDHMPPTSSLPMRSKASARLDTPAASRAEATDAAMGQRAECVMLNKGPHQVEAISQTL